MLWFCAGIMVVGSFIDMFVAALCFAVGSLMWNLVGAAFIVVLSVKLTAAKIFVDIALGK